MCNMLKNSYEQEEKKIRWKVMRRSNEYTKTDYFIFFYLYLYALCVCAFSTTVRLDHCFAAAIAIGGNVEQNFDLWCISFIQFFLHEKTILIRILYISMCVYVLYVLYALCIIMYWAYHIPCLLYAYSHWALVLE